MAKSSLGKEKPARKAGRAAERLREPMVYVESSALLAALLEGDASAIQGMLAAGRLVTSALTFSEANRALARARISGRLSAAEEREAIRGLLTFRRRCEIVNVSDEVLVRAGRPFPIEPIRTLDAIHIATAELLGEPPQVVMFVTRDKRVSENARVLGYLIG